MGLSPRGRGNPWHSSHGGVDTKSRVYPRVGGGTTFRCLYCRVASRAEVYPRVGGGTLSCWPGCRYYGAGSIPAWAGEPILITVGDLWAFTVYPRVGGGTRCTLTCLW